LKRPGIEIQEGGDDVTLEFTTLLKPLMIMPIVGVLLLGTAILIDRLRRRASHPHRA